ncbi:ABC transporter permease [Enterococcus cecorum]|uniref:ABC transporter permease n=1 Tax=Enterococcus cecorum TaxID=44008 RepID=UPI00200B6984|nr:ABC transporter permease [Enterococcus cecorum]
MNIIKKTIMKEWLVRRVDIKLFMMGRIFSSIISIIMMFLLSKVSLDLINKEAAFKFLHYSVLGLIIYNFSLSIIMGVGRSIVNEKRTNTLIQIVVSGEKLYKVLIGVFIANMPIALIETIILSLFALVLNLINISIDNWLIFVFSILLLLLSIFSIGIFFAFILGISSETFIIQNTAIQLLLLISGVTFPTEILPYNLGKILTMFPLRMSITRVRDILQYGYINNFSSILTEVGIDFLVIFTVFKLFKILERDFV